MVVCGFRNVVCLRGWLVVVGVRVGLDSFFILFVLWGVGWGC